MDEEAEDEHDPLIGTMVGRYRVERVIGQGGMGLVYEILQPAIHKRMALKLLHEEYSHRKEIVQRFFDEARAVNLISHPNIVDINDFSTLPDGRPFIIMEFLEGQSLEEYLETKGALDPEEALDFLKQITSALAAAHNKNIVHRDLKPENIFLLPLADGKHRVKVLDFGIAKLSDDSRGTGQQTQTGIVLGTPTYMSPEQAAGNSQKADHRTDIYSLGIILYQMLAGEPPFVGDSFAELMIKHIQAQAPNLRQTRSDLAPAWGDVVSRALRKEPDQRFQSMHALFNAAEQAASSRTRRPQAAVAATSLVKLPNGNNSQSSKLNKVPWIAGIGVVLVGAIGLTFWTKGSKGDSASSEPHGPALVENTAIDSSVPVIPAPDATAVGAALVLDAAVPDATVFVTADAASVIAKIASDATVEKVEAAPDAAVRKPVQTTKATKPAPSRATLVVQSSPWAIVYLDGKKLGPTPQNKKISSGRHKVKLRSDFSNKPQSFKFTIKPGKTHTIRAKWKLK